MIRGNIMFEGYIQIITFSINLTADVLMTKTACKKVKGKIKKIARLAMAKFQIIIDNYKTNTKIHCLFSNYKS